MVIGTDSMSNCKSNYYTIDHDHDGPLISNELLNLIVLSFVFKVFIIIMQLMPALKVNNYDVHRKCRH